MNYFTVDPNARYGTIAEQQRMCANIMSYTVIDWHAEGNLNTMMISLNGSGTASDPYTPAGVIHTLRIYYIRMPLEESAMDALLEK